jgi:hypothetical protein
VRSAMESLFTSSSVTGLVEVGFADAVCARLEDEGITMRNVPTGRETELLLVRRAML